MSGFIETPRFPDEIAYWLSGGTSFKTTVVETYGGNEFRNAAWSIGRAQYGISTRGSGEALRAINANSSYYFGALRNMFLVALGQLYAFRFKDWRDGTDEGGGTFVMLTATTFQMYKHYTISPLSYDQIIQKPVSPIVVSGGSGASVNYTTGVVTVSSGTPASWTGAFDKPVRFASDVPDIGPDPSGAMYDWQSLKLVEVRNP